ncbi:lipoprotein LpqH [Mycobacterium paraense]|uniref:lipoprotein LpqH n=1 Tax=Mycobacterium paraense TaxID=767916 RepID=UPI000A169106|nr:lipoprotein LpqH [Mycobacterium paraense]MCV7443438.1 lipoprotein LpqH [Mycobacterium paraense]
MKQDDPEKRISELERMQADLNATRNSAGPSGFGIERDVPGGVGWRPFPAVSGAGGPRRRPLWRRHPWAVAFVALSLLFVGPALVTWGLSRYSHNDAWDAYACAHGSTSGIDCSKYSPPRTSAPSPAMREGGHVRVKIDGRDQIAPTDITCFSLQSPPMLDISVGSNPGIYAISLNDTSAPTVHSLLLNPAGQGFTFDENTGEGRAAVTRTGDSYRITGEVVEHSDLKRTLKPFEIDVSCSAGK